MKFVVLFDRIVDVLNSQSLWVYFQLGFISVNSNFNQFITINIYANITITETLYRVSKKKLMPFQIQISREFHYGTLSIPIGMQRTDRV